MPALCHVGQDPKPLISTPGASATIPRGRLLGARGHGQPPALVARRRRKYHDGMSLTQLFKHVKALPTRQRARLVREILALEAKRGARPPSRRTGTRVRWPDVEARAKRIVRDRVLPNLVLLERGEEAS